MVGRCVYDEYSQSTLFEIIDGPVSDVSGCESLCDARERYLSTEGCTHA